MTTTTQLRQALRGATDDLHPPADLARAAIRTAGRVRRRRTALVSVPTLAVVTTGALAVLPGDGPARQERLAVLPTATTTASRPPAAAANTWVDWPTRGDLAGDTGFAGRVRDRLRGLATRIHLLYATTTPRGHAAVVEIARPGAPLGFAVVTEQDDGRSPVVYWPIPHADRPDLFEIGDTMPVLGLLVPGSARSSYLLLAVGRPGTTGIRYSVGARFGWRPGDAVRRDWHELPLADGAGHVELTDEPQTPQHWGWDTVRGTVGLETRTGDRVAYRGYRMPLRTDLGDESALTPWFGEPQRGPAYGLVRATLGGVLPAESRRELVVYRTAWLGALPDGSEAVVGTMRFPGDDPATFAATEDWHAVAPANPAAGDEPIAVVLRRGGRATYGLVVIRGKGSRVEYAVDGEHFAPQLAAGSTVLFALGDADPSDDVVRVLARDGREVWRGGFALGVS